MNSRSLVRSALSLIAAAAIAASCTATDDDPTFATSFSVEGGLAELSQFDSDDGFTIEMIDYVAASEAVGITPLSPGASADAVIEWVVQVGNSTTVADGGNGLALSIPKVIDAQGLNTPDALQNEFGWSFGSVTHFAEVSRLPERFSVLAGDLAWRDDLPEIEPGVRTIGDGEDGDLSTATTDLRPFGQPVRVAERDGLVAASLSTAPAVGWAAETHSSYAELPDLVEVATALDDRSVFQAVLLRSSGFSVDTTTLDNDLTATEALLDQPFSTLGLGVASVDDGLQHVVVYSFDTEDSAAAAAPQLEQIWTVGTSIIDGRPFTTLIEAPEVELDGRLVIVAGAAPESAVGFAVYRALAQGDLPFFHR